MTLPEFVVIFTSRRKLCATLILGSILLSWAIYRIQIQTYTVSLVVSVTRNNVTATPDYTYDQFYRLQADERFADTLVRYLGTAQAQREIANRAGLNSNEENFFTSKKIDAARLSSQLMTVTLSTRTIRGGERLAAALPEVLNQYAENLNREARDPNWFTVVASEPIITDARFDWRQAVVAGFLIGLFLSFWSALGGHYWRNEKGNAHRD